MRQRRLLGQTQSELGIAGEAQDIDARRAAAQRAEDDYRYRASRRGAEEEMDRAKLGEIGAQTDYYRAQAEKDRRPPIVRTHEALRQDRYGEWIDFSDPTHPLHTGEFGRVPPDREKSATELQDEAKAAAQAGMPDRDSYIAKRMNDWRQGYYGQLGITPQEVDAAKKSSSYTSNPAAERVHAAEADLYRRAEDAYKDDLERAVGRYRAGLTGGNGSPGRANRGPSRRSTGGRARLPAQQALPGYLRQRGQVKTDKSGRKITAREDFKRQFGVDPEDLLKQQGQGVQ
jgi:hypothetical protein